MSTFFHRIKLNALYIAKRASAYTASIYALAGLLSIFVSFEGIFKPEAIFLYKLLIASVVLIGVWILCAIFTAIVIGCTNKKKVVEGHNGKSVYVLYGDLFDGTIVNDSKRYIAFAVNRCFDTIVDDRLITSTSIHGMAFKSLYEQGLFTLETLDDAIQTAITPDASHVDISQTDKTEGNLMRYEAGTYANVEISDKENYLLVGLSYIDSNLNAQTPLLDYVISVQKMIESFDKESQGFPVLLPIIGTGRSRTNLNEREALEYMIEAFKINQNRINSDIYIVVYESAKNRVAIADL